MKRIALISLSIISLVLFMACGGSDTPRASELVNNPNTADGNADMDDLPVFKFETETYDFGKIRQGEVVTHVFKFTNVGKRDLVISGQKATCGCTVADYPHNPIKPGEQGLISIQFNSEGKKGMQTKTVTLTANTQPNTKVLTIKTEVVL